MIEQYKWPKRHEYVIQQCRGLTVADVLGYLDRWHRTVLSAWSPPTHPALQLVMHYGGPFRRWWFVCPGCQRRCEALYVPPDARPDDWRCRLCDDLIYACQRWGPRHPLGRRLTHRRRRTMQREVSRQEWAAARRAERRRRQAPRWGPEERAAEDRAIAGLIEYGRRLDADAAAVRERLNAEAAATEARLRELAAGSGRVAAGARRTLARIERQRGSADGTAPAGKPPIATARLTAEDVERLKRVAAELGVSV